MPEGPEVEIVRRGLKNLYRQKIIGIFFSSHKKYSSQGLKSFSKLLGTQIKEIKRKGKWLIFVFDNEIKAINHLGMSGKWLLFEHEKNISIKKQYFCEELDFKEQDIEKKHKEISSYIRVTSLETTNKEGSKINSYYLIPKEGQKFIETKNNPLKKSFEEEILYDKHIKLIIFLEKYVAIFSDPRIFGQFRIIDDEETKKQLKRIEHLGPDILEKPFDIERFIGNLKRHPKITIASALLRTDIVLGVGNIYRSEALFRAKISPFRRINQIKKEELRVLGKKIHEVGMEALRYGGSSIQSYVNTDGRSGGMQERFLVYGKNKQPCVVCGNEIKKDKIDGRSIYWCEYCQK